MQINFESLDKELVVNGVKYVPKPEEVDLGALSMEFYCQDLGYTLTVKDYLKELLHTLWSEEDSFSGKRPFGNSCWQFDAIRALVEAGYIEGEITYDEDGYVEESNYDRKEAENFILNLIKSL